MIELNERYTYDELVEIGKTSANGEIYLNIERCPVLIKHPIHNIFTIFGYSRTTLKVSFAQTIDQMFLDSSPSIAKTHHNPFEVQSLWDELSARNILIRLGSDRTILKFAQEFLFSQKFRYESSGQHWRDFNNAKEVIIQIKAYDRKLKFEASDSNVLTQAYPEALTFSQLYDKYLSFKTVDPYAASIQFPPYSPKD